MDVKQIEPGLWRWTGFHEEWKQDVGCVYAETSGALCLFDPLMPPGGTERFLAALDRDVERLGLPVHVFVTVYWHARSAGELAARYGAEVWASSRIRAAVQRRAGQVHAFRPGDPLPGSVEPITTPKRNDTLYFLHAHGALVCGDVILGGLRFCPESWLPAGVRHADLRAGLQPLLRLPVRHVLVSHGEPAIGDGASALRVLLA